MYEFNYYNAAQPQIITSFKGNQKLILGGYRYNIHHVKEGIKTWRCVCAKKLTGARSWCKGRAETWDSDTKGIPKGEHNHQTEHDLAELEYFKSQLIFAAISDSTADLNLLIDEAGKFLSQGLNFGNRESMKKSLIVARKSAESGELKLGQQPHRSIKGVKRASVRSKASIPSSTLRSSSAVNKNLSTSTTSTIQSQSSQNVSHQTYSCSSPFSPNISSSSRNNNNSSGIGSSLSTSDCFDNSYFSSTNSQNNWNQNNSNFELPSSSGLLFNDGEASAAINAYGNVNMPSEQILAAALFAAAMIGSTQASQNSNYNHQQFQEANIDNNNSVLSSIPSKKARGNNALNITRSVTTNGGAMPISTSKINIPAQTNSLKRKGARVNGILQKLSNKAVTETNNVFSPAQQRLMEIKKEKNELNACFNTVNKNGEDEEDIKPLNPLAHKRLLVNVQTQTDDNFGGEIETKGCANKVENDDNNSNEKGKVVLNGFNHLQSSPKRLICCCCFDSDKAEEGFNSDEFPVGCKKRSKLLLEKDEAAAADKYIKRDEKEMHLEIEEKD